MDAAVVIPTRDRPQRLAATLARLAAQEGADGWQVVVARDALDRGDHDVLADRDWPFGLQVVQAATPGASAARNAGWRATAARIVVFLGDDILAAPGLLEAHRAAHERDPADELAVLGRVEWASHLRITPFMRWLEHGIQFDYGRIAGRELVDWWFLYSANVSFKRPLLEAVGGFDEERFPIYYEDLDLGARMAEHGLRLRYEPRALGEHDHPQRLADWEGRIALVAAAERRFVERHPAGRPYFHELFAAALARPRARGLSARLAAIVPPGLPLLGPRVHASFDLRHRQALARPFMAAWEALDQTGSSAGSNPGGSAPGGPKNSSGRAGTPAATV